MLLLTIAVFGLNGATALVERTVSAVDEREHIDHLVQGADFEVPQVLDLLRQETLRELCDRRSEIVNFPKCKPGTLDPLKFSVGGVNAAGDSPIYYLVTGPTARALDDIAPFWDSLVTWARLLGSVWLLLAFYLMLRAAEALGIRQVRMVVVLIFVAALPAVLEATSTVTPDATAFVAGAAVLVSALTWERTGQTRWLVVGALAAGTGMMFKTSNGIGILIVLVYLAVRALASFRNEAGEHAQPWRRYALMCGVVIVACVIGLEVLLPEVQNLRNPPCVSVDTLGNCYGQDFTPEVLATAPKLDPLRNEAHPDTFGPASVFAAPTLFGMFPPTNEIAPPIRRSTGPHAPWYLAIASGAVFFIVGALLLSVYRPSWNDRVKMLGIAVMVGLVAGASLLVLYTKWRQNSVLGIVPRYGLSAMPAIALVLAVATRERLTSWVMIAVTAGLYVTALYTIV